ncbi:MAG TPA: tetratricopeptide repeat protein, partial [Terriglobia bacterium]|nr:tetratricopeptide repeat protein [Terriglobia bacterium]
MRAYHRFGAMATVPAVRLARLAFWLSLASLVLGSATPVIRAQDSEPAFVDQISSLVSSGQLDRAVDAAREAVGRFPHSSQLYQLYGVALFKKGANEDARAAFRRAVELDPSVPQNYYDLAL